MHTKAWHGTETETRTDCLVALLANLGLQTSKHTLDSYSTGHAKIGKIHLQVQMTLPDKSPNATIAKSNSSILFLDLFTEEAAIINSDDLQQLRDLGPWEDGHFYNLRN